MNKLTVVILGLVCFAIYFSALSNGFVFDDKALIVSNPLLKSPRQLSQIFKAGLYDFWAGPALYDRMYRPLQVLSYWMDYRIWGLRPFGFRLTNILLHLFNSILLYYLLSLIFKENKLPGFVSILFFIHPLNSSLAVYISSRGDLLSSFFMFLSMIIFLKYIRRDKERKIGLYALSLFTASAALLCRENAVILFLFIALIMLTEKVKTRDYRFVIPFILLNLAYFSLRFYIFGYSGLFMHPEILSFPLRVVNFFNIVFRYLWLLFLPLGLHLFRGTQFILKPAAANAMIIWAAVLLSAAIVIRSRKNKPVCFGIFWFLTGLLPVLFFLDGYPMFHQAMMAESWVYLSSTGFFILFFSLLSKFKNIGPVILCVFVIFYGLLSIANNAYWNNDLLVHKRIVEYNLEPNPVRKDLIDDYLAAGLYEDALREVKNFSSYCPAIALSDVVWGNYYFATGQITKAAESYALALRKSPGKNFFLYQRLNLCYKMMGKEKTLVNNAK